MMNIEEVDDVPDDVLDDTNYASLKK